MRGPSPGSTSGSEVAKNRMPRIVASTRSGYTLTVMAPCAPRAAESTDGVVSQATNSASSHTLPDAPPAVPGVRPRITRDRKSTRLNSSHLVISYAVFCLKKKKHKLLLPELVAQGVLVLDRD